MATDDDDDDDDDDAGKEEEEEAHSFSPTVPHYLLWPQRGPLRFGIH